MLTPAQINSKQFKVVRLGSGYDQAEVDDFLDSVQADYEWLYQYRQQTPPQGVQRAEQPTQRMPVQSPPSEMIAKILAVAEETAEKHVHEGKVEAESYRLKAKDEAEVLIGNTQLDATAIMENARKQAAEIVAVAQDEKHKIIGQLEDQRAHLKEKVDELIRVEQEVTSRMHNALERWNT